VTCDDAKELARFIEANGHRVAYDAVDAPTFLATANAELTVTQELWPKVRFHALREHAGLVFQQRLDG
jgi:peptide chain release factor 3